MQIHVNSPEEYIAHLPEDRKTAMTTLRKIILDHLPAGFEETINDGMIGYVVPLSLYPKGYHCNPSTPLLFLQIASQKNNIALYHFGIYCDPTLLIWFVQEYPKHCSTKLDMGKSCIRFKKMEQIPYDLIGKLCQKMTVAEWIEKYENIIKK